MLPRNLLQERASRVLWHVVFWWTLRYRQTLRHSCCVYMLCSAGP